MDQIPVIVSVPNHLSELLQRPGRTRVRRHVHARQTARAMLDDDKHVQHPKTRRNRNEEVACEDAPCMTLQERRPAQLTARSPGSSLRQVLAHGSWRDPDRKSTRLNSSHLVISY